MEKNPQRGKAVVLILAMLATGCGMKCYKSHYAATGETVDDVCERYEIGRDALIKENRIDSSYSLKTGDRLFIPCANYEKGEKKPAFSTKSHQSRSSDKNGGASSVAGAAAAGASGAAGAAKASAKTSSAPKKEAKQPPGPMPPATVKFVWPLDGEIIRGFTDGRDAAGNGLDLKANPGATVRAAADGKVEYAGTPANAYGPMILVSHEDNFYTVYSRLGSISVKKGQSIAKGATVGAAGTEGYVHFEVRAGRRAIDPVLYLPKR